MLNKQKNLATSFPGFMETVQEALETPDYRVMVVDTDPSGGNDGFLAATSLAASLLAAANQKTNDTKAAGNRGGESTSSAGDRAGAPNRGDAETPGTTENTGFSTLNGGRGHHFYKIISPRSFSEEATIGRRPGSMCKEPGNNVGGNPSCVGRNSRRRWPALLPRRGARARF